MDDGTQMKLAIRLDAFGNADFCRFFSIKVHFALIFFEFCEIPFQDLD